MLLVTGVSGVGKTFTILQALENNPSIRRLSGSSILRELDKPITNLTEPEARDNQSAIVNYLGRLSSDRLSHSIFDGHATIETSDELWPVPIDIVRRMRVCGLALVEDMPDALTQRRITKGRRSDQAWIERLIDCEQRRSEELATALSLPFHLVPSGDVSSLLNALAAVSRTKPAGIR